MNWYEHHLGDWLKDCVGLSATEEGIYLRLVGFYYAQERPLSRTDDEIFRAARPDKTEHATVARVLRRFFTLTEDGWRHSRCDKEIAKYLSHRPKSQEAKLAQSERQRRSREYRRALFTTLRDAGAVPSAMTPNDELVTLCKTIGVEPPSRQPVTAPVTGHVTGHVTGNGHDIQNPLPISYGGAVTGHSDQSQRAPIVTGSAVTTARASSACKAMQKVGFDAVRPADPRLLALLAQGATDAELAETASEAAACRKSWAWLLATVEGRRRDASRIALEGPTATEQAWVDVLTGKDRRDAESAADAGPTSENVGSPRQQP